MKPELLAMKLVMIQKHCEYLLGDKCVVWTVIQLNTAWLGATKQHSVAKLAVFDYIMRYCAGHTKQNADALFR